jgi:hypothetical protein
LKLELQLVAQPVGPRVQVRRSEALLERPRAQVLQLVAQLEQVVQPVELQAFAQLAQPLAQGLRHQIH